MRRPELPIYQACEAAEFASCRRPPLSLELRTAPPLRKHKALVTLNCVFLEPRSSAKSHLARLLLYKENYIRVGGVGVVVGENK